MTLQLPWPEPQAPDEIRDNFDAVAQSIGVANTMILSGTGSPETVVTAPVGCLFLRRDGGALTTLYVKEVGVGNVGWAAK